MSVEQLILHNSTLYQGKNPYTYAGVDISQVLFHKLAAYNGHLESFAPAIIEADRGYCDRDEVVDEGVDFNLTEVLRLNQHRQSCSIFKVPNFDGALQKVHRQIENLYSLPHYRPFEIPLRGCKPASSTAWESLPQRPHVFLASLDSYLNPLKPVMAELVRSGEPVLLIVPRESTEWKTARDIPRGVKQVCMEALFNPEIHSRFAGIDIEGDWEKSLQSFRENVKWGRIFFFDVLCRCYREVYLNLIPHVIAFIEIASRLVEKTRPKSLFVARLRRSVENAFNEVFRKNGIPTFMIPHGHISHEDARYFTDGYFDRSSRVFVWGRFQKKAILAKRFDDVSEDRIVVSGNPAWDIIVERRKRNGFQNIDRILFALGLKNSRYILFITQGIPGEPSVYEKIIQAAEPVSDDSFVIKVHPHDDRASNYRHLVSEKVAVIDHPAEIDVYSLLHHARIVLTHSSTMNLEALLCGASVGTLRFPEFEGWPILIDLTEYGMPVFGTAQEVAGFLSNGSRKQRPSCPEFAGSAARTIVKDLLSQIGCSSPLPHLSKTDRSQGTC